MNALPDLIESTRPSEANDAYQSKYISSTDPNNLSKYVLKQLISNRTTVSYPNLIKIHYNNANDHEGFIKKQFKPKIITVINGGSEIPKRFVKILLTQRYLKSYDALITKIEESFHDKPKRRIDDIYRIFNVFGNEIKSIQDFYQSDDLFVAIGDQDTLDTDKIKEILDNMYPDHPQTNNILQYWKLKTLKTIFNTENESKSIYDLQSKINVSEANALTKESQYLSNINTLLSKQSNIHSKQKKHKNILNTSRTKKDTSKSKGNTIVTPRIKESDLVNQETMSRRYSPHTFKKMIQEGNAERLRAAYEDRENARLLVQEQLKIERKRLNNSDGTYSRYIKQLINDKSPITVFKKIDEVRNENRKKRLRFQVKIKHVHNTAYKDNMVDSSGDQNNNGPIDQDPVFIDQNINAEQNATSTSQGNEMTSLVKEELHEIMDVSNIRDIIDQSHIIYDQKDTNYELKNENEVKITALSPSHERDKMRNIDDSETQQIDNNTSQKKALFIPQNNTNINGNNHIQELNGENKIALMPELSKQIIFNLKDASLQSHDILNSSHNIDRKPKERESDTEKITELPKSPNREKEIRSNIRLLREKISSPKQIKIFPRDGSLPGNRVLGKLCRQISSSQIFYERYETSAVLGDGNFAVVKKAVRRESKREYAVKIIEKSKMLNKEYMIENEIWIMKLCNHNNIVKLKEEYETKNEVFLVLELIKGGDLFEAIAQNIKFSEIIASKMVLDMANALFYLHCRQIVHRDVKPENIMVLRHRDGSFTLKLADFGLAMEVKSILYTICGTATYVAPEILSEKGYSLEVDLWALGVILYILLCGFPPFQCKNNDQEQLFEVIQSGSFEYISPYWDKISNDVKHLISKLLTVDKQIRYSTIHVLSHKWIMSKGLSQVINEESRQLKAMELENDVTHQLEHFQRKKKELRQSVNREIHASYPKISK